MLFPLLTKKTMNVPGEIAIFFELTIASESSLDDGERVIGVQIIRDLTQVFPESNKGIENMLLRGLSSGVLG